jgi:hypothetical protein
MRSTSVADAIGSGEEEDAGAFLRSVGTDDPEALIARLEAEMLEAARLLEFERAASLRDSIDEVRAALAVTGRSGPGGEGAVRDAARRERRAGGSKRRTHRRRGGA